LIPVERERRLRAALERLATSSSPFSGYCFRCLLPRFASRSHAFSGDGAFRASGRFHRRGLFRIVYTSLEPETALWETLRLARGERFEQAALLPRLMLSAHVELHTTLDLTDAKIRRRLGTTLRELRDSEWMASEEESFTQTLGRLSYEIGYEAIQVPSSSGGRNLNLFPDNLQPESQIVLVNEGWLPSVL
jgi:RES domain-containing protein